MPQIDAAKIWSLNYRLLVSVISAAEPDIAALGFESKELFLLAEVDEHPYPAELAATLCMPKPTVTLYLTEAGRQANQDGLALLSDGFSKRLERLTLAQQEEFKSLLEQIL
jgi:hypothetical protein